MKMSLEYGCAVCSVQSKIMMIILPELFCLLPCEPPSTLFSLSAPAGESAGWNQELSEWFVAHHTHTYSVLDKTHEAKSTLSLYYLIWRQRLKKKTNTMCHMKEYLSPTVERVSPPPWWWFWVSSFTSPYPLPVLQLAQLLLHLHHHQLHVVKAGTSHLVTRSATLSPWFSSTSPTSSIAPSPP